MRILSRLVTGAAVAAAAVAMVAAPALADPPTGVTPRAVDVVGVGSDTIQNVFDQFSIDYNKTLTKAKSPRLYSWDALNPKTGLTDNITAKAGCAKAPRPNGSSAGIDAATGGALALTANTKTKTKTFCTDFARSSRGFTPPGDPSPGPGGIQFLPFAQDAVTYATNGVTNAPAKLTTAQLAAIYTCVDTNWNQVGGKNAPINAQLPQTGSGTRKFFLTAVGSGTAITPGSCVNASAGEQAGAGKNFPQENEGVNKYLQGPNVIYPYSIGKYIAEVFHSAKCLNVRCSPVRGVICKPKKGQNRFGCDTHGKMVLRSINGTKPTVGTGAKQTINPKFSAAFRRLVYVVVRWAASQPGNVPKNLQKTFGPKGFICTSKTAHADLINYGFLSLGKSCQ